MDASQVILLVVEIIAFTAVVIGVVFVVAFLGVRGLANRVISDMQARYPNARLIVKNASFFGQESLGVTQGRGNGTLVIADRELVFVRWLPRKEYVVPLKSITGLETPSSFLGKTRFTPLLKVNFTNDSGQPDSMAWQVANLGDVKTALESAMR